jgi:hypothetical protein
MNLNSQSSVDGRVRIQSLTPTNPTVENSNRQSVTEFPPRLSTSSPPWTSPHNHQSTGESASNLSPQPTRPSKKAIDSRGRIPNSPVDFLSTMNLSSQSSVNGRVHHPFSHFNQPDRRKKQSTVGRRIPTSPVDFLSITNFTSQSSGDGRVHHPFPHFNQPDRWKQQSTVGEEFLKILSSHFYTLLSLRNEQTLLNIESLQWFLFLMLKPSPTLNSFAEC